MADAVAAPTGAPTPAGSPGQSPAQPGAAPKPGEPSQETQARRLKVRLDGPEEVELDESDLVTNYKKGKGAAQLLTKATERRQEALKAKAEAEGLLKRLKEDPRAALRDLGVDVRKLSESTILEEIELEKMTPAERRAYEAEQKLKGYEAEKQKAEQERQQAAFEEEKARHQDEFAHLFLSTMEATGLPKASGRFVAWRMAHLYQQNEEAGLESSPEEMAAHVMEGLRTEHRGVVSGLEGEALLEFLGPDVVKKVLSIHLQKARAKRGVGAPPPRTVEKPQEQRKVDPRKGLVDFRAIMRGD